jgi:hypothetical protein
MDHTTEIHLLAPEDEGGWTARRREVIDAALGICTRCGMPDADTATRGWADIRLVAAHTRCVVGLGPPTTPDRRLLQVEAV